MPKAEPNPGAITEILGRPRVLLDDRLSTGGVGRYARDLCLGLSRSDAVGAIPYSSLPRSIPALASTTFTPWGRLSVGARARKEKVHLLHGLHLDLAFFKPAVVTIHDVIPLQHPSSMPSRARRIVFERILRSSLERSDAVIVPSIATKDSLTSFLEGTEKVFVVPHGISEVFYPLTDAEQATARGRFAGGAPYVCAVAGDKSHKNPSGLNHVARLLREEGIPTIAAGSTRGLDGIRTVGAVGDVELRLLFGGADVFLSMSHLEGFGLPAAEAVACGTPVVCSPRTGGLQWFSPGALEVDVADPRTVARAVTTVVADKERRARLSSDGLSAIAPLTIEAMASRTIEVYRDVLHGS